MAQSAFSCTKITKETLEQCVDIFKVNNKVNFIVNFEHISHLVLEYIFYFLNQLLLTLNRLLPA